MLIASSITQSRRSLRSLASVCCLLLAAHSRAATYFVATNGSDANPGISLAQPFLTISKAASVVNAGDVVNIRGGVYRETVTFSRSGTPAASIVFQNYSNEIATVNGADVITNSLWNVYSNSIWRAAVSWTMGDGKDQVFLDAQSMNMARWPNSSLDLSHPVVAVVDSVSIPDVSNAVVTLNDSALTQPAGFWLGARLNMGVGAIWVSKTYTVTNSNAGSLIFYAGNAGNSNYRPAAGNPFFLWGVLNALDTAGEWFLDTAAGELYLWTPTGDSPTNHLVEARRRTYAFDFNSRSNIVVRGLRIFAATVNMSSSSKNNTLDGIQARYVSQFTVITSPFNTGNTDTGFLISGTSNNVLNSVIGWSAGNGIMLAANGGIVSNCVIHDVDYAANDPGAIFPTGNNQLIIRNTLYNSGRSVLLAGVSASHILYNHVFNAGLQMQDLGCLYTDGHDGAGTEIAYNIFHSSHPLYGGKIGAGLYLDNNSPNYNAHHNVCYDAARALMSNLPGTNQLIYNNTLLGDSYSVRGSGTPPNGSSTQFKNNIFRNTTNTYFGTNAVFSNNLLSSTDPLFVDTNENNFQLKPASPAIDAGAVLPPYTDGYLGAAPELGAFEYGATPWTAGAFLNVGGFYDAEIGGATPGGGIDAWDGRYLIQGGGTDIGGTSDQLHFSYVPLTNNYFQIVARVTSLQSPLATINASMKCGVMIRETLTGRSKHASMVITPGNSASFLFRNETGSPGFTSPVAGQAAPIWLKMMRIGNTFAAFYSSDSTNWSQIGAAQPISMSNAVYAGLCLSSHVSGTVAEATVDNVSINSLTPAPPQISAVLDASDNVVLIGSGTAGWGYSILETSDLSVPLTNWPVLSTGTFGTDGTFTFTNAPGGSSKEFYRLQLQ
jgi:hypothetical protein